MYCTKSTISSAEVTCDTTEDIVHLFKLAGDLWWRDLLFKNFYKMYFWLPTAKQEKNLFLVQMSPSSRSSVMRDTCQKSSIQKGLWHVTEEMVGLVQYCRSYNLK
jgi:hypothetical protein